MTAKDETLDPSAIALLRQVAEEDADAYLREALLPAWADALECEPAMDVVRSAARGGRGALRLVLCRYVFGHRRFLRFRAAEAAAEAIDQVVTDVDQFLRRGDGDAFWASFAARLTPKAQKSQDQLRALVEGVLSLCFDVYRHSGEESLIWWMAEEVRETSRVEHLHEILREIRGLGPKSLSRLLRDVVVVFDLERRVHPADRYLLTAVGRPIRMLAAEIVPESRERKLPDWILAGKVSKACRLAGVSAARFNMGAEWRFLIAGGEEEA